MSKAAELAALIGSQTALSNRNLIINGAMQVAQRGTSASVSNGSNEGYQTLDRFGFYYSNNAGGEATVSQSTDVPSGYGFTNSYKADVTTADTSIGVNHTIFVSHSVEAQNVANSGWNHTSSSSYMTLSFWAKSVKAGTYCVAIIADDSASNRIFVKEYTLVANTWKKVEITFPGESGVTVNNDNGVGLQIKWVLQTGTDADNATDNTWNSSDTSPATSNQVNFFDSTSSDFYLTGVQLQVGEQATAFEHRSFGDELRRCQRYFQKSYNYGTDPGSATEISAIYHRIDSSVSNRTPNITFPVEMRTATTVVLYSLNGTSGAVSDCATGFSHSSNVTGSAFSGTDGTHGLSKLNLGTAKDDIVGFHYTAEAEL